MWSTALSLLASLIDTKYFKAALIALACAFSAWVAYSYQGHRYEAQIAQINSTLAEATARQEKEYAERLSKATSDLVLANRRADTARSERDALLDRLHNANDSETKRADSNPSGSYREEYAQCRKLLSEGIDLLNEGADLAGKIAREKDALAEIVK